MAPWHLQKIPNYISFKLDGFKFLPIEKIYVEWDVGDILPMLEDHKYSYIFKEFSWFIGVLKQFQSLPMLIKEKRVNCHAHYNIRAWEDYKQAKEEGWSESHDIWKHLVSLDQELKQELYPTL